ncbi:PAS domain-containing sensor histidine kinase [Hyalangium rubrum]|uniref:histidine kinase n=1 Tax=Hyalangium rubrum TaxID=3103134 RepID=A0ABU5GXJ4_9BACT|nr:PAS domain-containing protein [Hyalangium sp. s54d21]MDY7225903.1 PAS domain-containing protein [Hyalangium sp. s54d21]
MRALPGRPNPCVPPEEPRTCQGGLTVTPADGGEFKLLIEAMADPLVACDGEERIVHLTQSAERLLGWSREELRGQPFNRLVPTRLHTVDGRSLLRYLLDRRCSDGGCPILLPLQRREGEELMLEVTAGSARAGESERVVLSLRRIPEAPDFRRTALEQDTSIRLWQYGHAGEAHAPAVAERLYQVIVENAPLGIFHFDRTPIVTACNDYFVRIIGSSKRLILGLNLLTLRDERIMRCIRATLTGKHTRFEGEYHSITAKKVTPVRTLFAPCYDEHGEVSGGVGIIEDITWQRRMEQERATREAQVNTLLDTAPIGLAFLDMELRYVRINDVLARFNGHPPEAHLGRRPREVLGPPGALLEQRLQRVLESGVPIEKVELSSSADFGFPGPERFWASSLYPVRTPDGRVLGLGAVVEDITERRHAEEERTRLYREAQEAVRVRDDFLTIASHELKTPLTPLALRLAGLERRLDRGEQVDPSSLRHARQHLLRLTALINDLLDASRIESGRLALHPQPTRLDTLVEHVIHVTEGTHDAEHRIEFQPPAAPAQVLGDPYRLEQVIANLLENALKYSPDGGTIHVALEPRGELVLLTVRDPGIGIPPDQQERLFERYFRARNVSTHSYGGLGLGLYICRDIVERHGGSIWVESEVGRGSTFYVALPTLPATPVAPPHLPERHVH